MLENFLSLEQAPYSEEDAEWDAFVRTHPHGSLLQTIPWAQLKNRFGWSSQRVWMRQEGKLVAGAQILFRGYAWGAVKIGYMPHGPLVDWHNPEQVDILFNQIDLAAYKHRAGMVKFEPLLWQSEIPPTAWQQLCQRHGCLPTNDTIQPPHTILIDLRPSLDDILANMKSKTRYNIRLSGRKGVIVRQGDKTDLPAFVKMMALTGQRDGFDTHTPLYYRDAYDFFSPNNVALFIAEYEKRPLAALMIFTNGSNAYYLYGASNNEERQRMPAYAVQWAAIQWAKARGCTSYDLWGIPDAPLDELEANFTQRHDGLWGVYRFKRGFGGQLARTVGAAERVYNKRLYKLYQWRRNRQ